jgi:iron complex transport system substrate-binding protein
MSIRTYYIYILTATIIVSILAGGCTHKHATPSSGFAAAIDSLIPIYSHSFRVDYYDGYRVISVYSGADKATITTYLLTSKDAQVPGGISDAVRINFPATRVACMSTTHLGAMKLLNARNFIAATTNSYLVCDSLIKVMIASGVIKDVGKDYQPDYEVISQSKPDLIFTDGENSGTSQMYAKMKALKINVVFSRDYFEQQPLARAEWIKFFGAFIGREKLADSLFKVVETDYSAEKDLIARTGDRPTVFCNLPYTGIWYMPCGENYAAKLITDAGGQFLWTNDKPMNGLNLTLNFEQVYGRAAEADFWINTNTNSSLSEIGNLDAKLKLFKAFKTGMVFNGIKRVSPAGGMDIWETGSYLPNIVLRDLALIFHSHGPIDEKLYYYKQLK